MYLLLARAAILLCLVAVPEAGSARQIPRIAVAVSGAVWTMRADGSDRHRLTPQRVAYEPELSPDSRLVAYLGYSAGCVIRQVHGLGGPAPLPDTLSVVPSRGRGPRWVACARAGFSGAWSPNSRLLAYFDRETLIVRSSDGRHADAVLAPDRYYGYVQAVWSPDSRQMAVPLYGPGSGLFEDRTLRLAIVQLHGPTRRITIRFPAGSLGANNWADPSQPPGSFPTYNHLTWTRDGRHLLVDTVGNGRALYLTGIWEVSTNGGFAHLVAGTSAGVREHAPPGPSLDHATGFAVSPDATRLATNPRGRLWVGDLTGHHGRLLTPSGCPLEQVRWLPDSSGLAYVASCTRRGRYTSMLVTIRLAAPAPRVLVQSAPEDIDLDSPFL